MTLIPLEIPAGIVKTRTATAAQGRFLDCDHVRFVNGYPQKWNGWVRQVDDTIDGTPRGALEWTNQFGSVNTGFGSHLRLYALTGVADTLKNITPIRDEGSLTDPFTTEDGSAIVEVSHTDHGLRENDMAIYSDADAVGGLTIDGEYRVREIKDNSTYTIEADSEATAGATGGGTVNYEYEATVGNSGSVAGLGYGAGAYGEGTYGTPREGSEGIFLQHRHWSLGQYGSYLMALPSGGQLYYWNDGEHDRAQLVENSPTARAMFVTAERFVFMLGTDTTMTVQWPDQDNFEDWTPSSSNTANSRKLQDGSRLIGGTSVIDNVSLVWSDAAAYVFQYTGATEVYASRLAGTNCGLIGPLAFTTINGRAFWMSPHNFHYYDGGIDVVPNAEDIRAHVFDEINPVALDKSYCIYNRVHNEIMWGYAAGDSSEPNKYVAVSLVDFSWVVGTLERTCGAAFRAGDGGLVMADPDGVIYRHEDGQNADGEPLEAFITYGLYAIARGQQNVDVIGFVPDFERQSGDVDIELYSRDRPNSKANLDEQTVTVSEGDEMADARLQARYFGFTVRSAVEDGDFRLGIPQLEIGSAGARR